MPRYILGRVLLGVLTLFVLSVVIFALSRETGDPLLYVVGTEATPEQREQARQDLGLDKPLPTQYLIWAGNAVQGDFGKALVGRRPAADVVMERFPATVKLAVAAMLFAIPLGLMLGVLSAVYKDRLVDAVGRTVAILGQSLPSFWIGIMLMLVFSVKLGLLPAAGMGGPKYFILPTVTVGMFLIAAITRLTRSSMVEVLANDYIRTARAKGLPERLVIARHALRNAAIPVLTLSAIMFAYALTGSVVAETVFAWPGVGRLAFQSVTARDFPVVQVVVLLYGAIFIAINLLTDILYSWIDPRIRYG